MRNKINVPCGMLEAANSACIKEIQRIHPTALIGYVTVDAADICDKVIEAVLRWQSENPPVPRKNK